MGIRYDRVNRRATNGPMIFFSDPSALGNFSEEVTKAVEGRLSFYAYRRPGDMMMTFGSSEGFVRGIGVPGFVISPFNDLDSAITIPWKTVAGMERSSGKRKPFPSCSTTLGQHRAEVEAIVGSIAGDPVEKTVAATVTCLDTETDPSATFMKLCGSFPECFVFMFSTPATGFWIGASPELLLETTATGIHTVALAGTRPASPEDPTSSWDEKNTAEQATVTAFVTEALEQQGFTPLVLPTETKTTGKLQHLQTDITASGLPDSPDSLLALLDRLSPTPAVCGFPRDRSAELINRFEHFDRDCYGGFCGPFRSPSDFSFFVTLRCAQLSGRHTAVYAGGGITCQSRPETEWEETRRKADAFISNLTAT